ncbi:2-succinyl-5-enolpyruvyl-6-hydroxy-3-cyclohexene-1-carboxylic-acid synthase [Vibrio ostreicida]|uniref:2-succinyl-5-enolpyruvyl-6-hydroxy-3-cyclohexene-1-carboxylate synthase n=1 Tax=Vibrio ostreicida TaxID=526588 RepID=A0ABT8BTK1_9VIBR|nr:2-succinyl-5-enolpyruvyl-6-hydroxy-3-cyclohexene-1-carboxylic-acid synthase [Vibrio ostreicida]MDN3610470.1 2-succinyl-5-enolpyruvyl-6-hydroxy-3-cyclohexene-1-carboxylic-acid synthase [Vibrio ostreicida]NPD07527.1 2-succinyl-5-enolpyruvyl-6-hydroxy-3-cyclohexene-1-carboxylic-acid synthase [Vibrio ostreicida]
MRVTHRAILNRIWCQIMLEELGRLGVNDVCFAPGSRSTPLILEAQAHRQFKLHGHFDERGLGFLALGLAKASQRPVALIVTSGTAVANLLPAVAEARLTGEKLVLLTADRPIELIDCGANQAIVQTGLYSNQVTASLNLPSPSAEIPLKWLLTSIDQLMTEQALKGGPIHINCPFPEPLYSSESHTVFQDYLACIEQWKQSGQAWSTQSGLRLATSGLPDALIAQKGLIIIGSTSRQEAEQARMLAIELGWPYLCDPQSGLSSPWAHYDLWLKNPAAQTIMRQCDVIIQFGSRLISKRLCQWVASQVEDGHAEYHYVSPHLERNNPSHLPQHHHLCQIEDWVEGLMVKAKKALSRGWGEALQYYSENTACLTQVLIGEALTEIGLALTLRYLPKDTQVFLGNSLFVRLVDMFGCLKGVDSYSNRGASGIDGLVATAAGVARHSVQPTVIYIGDTSLLYDLNSLALFSGQKTPVVLVVINNDGGAIFDLLPVPEQNKATFYQRPHGYDFKCAAEQFKLGYQLAYTLNQYRVVLETHLRDGEGAMVVEVQTPSGQAASQLKQIVEQLDAF